MAVVGGDEQVAVLTWQGAQGCRVGVQQRPQDRREGGLRRSLLARQHQHGIGAAISEPGEHPRHGEHEVGVGGDVEEGAQPLDRSTRLRHGQRLHAGGATETNRRSVDNPPAGSVDLDGPPRIVTKVEVELVIQARRRGRGPDAPARRNAALASMTFSADCTASELGAPPVVSKKRRANQCRNVLPTNRPSLAVTVDRRDRRSRSRPAYGTVPPAPRARSGCWPVSGHARHHLHVDRRRPHRCRSGSVVWRRSRSRRRCSLRGAGLASRSGARCKRSSRRSNDRLACDPTLAISSSQSRASNLLLFAAPRDERGDNPPGCPARRRSSAMPPHPSSLQVSSFGIAAMASRTRCVFVVVAARMVDRCLGLVGEGLHLGLHRAQRLKVDRANGIEALERPVGAGEISARQIKLDGGSLPPFGGGRRTADRQCMPSACVSR